MTLGTGVGGGIVAEGRLLHGVPGAAGNLVTSQLTLMIQSNVPVVKKAVLKRLPQQLGSLTSLVVTPMSTKETLN